MLLISGRTDRVVIYTIGFTKKNAETFFTKLSKADVEKLVDIRLKNVSQLAGFAKKDDLNYFLKTICGISYDHQPILAPTKELMDEYKNLGEDWKYYEDTFNGLLRDRTVGNMFTPEYLDKSCLMCSEDRPDKCHRRLVAEYFAKQWQDVKIIHL